MNPDEVLLNVLKARDKMTKPVSGIEETLQRLTNLVWANADTVIVDRGINEASQSIKNYVLTEIIGEDEEVDGLGHRGHRNRLRAEQRSKLNGEKK